MGGSTWQVAAAAAAAASVAVAAAAGLLGRTRARRGHGRRHAGARQPGDAVQARARRPAAAAAAATTAAIPAPELRRLQALLRRVYRWRGWQGGPYHVTLAWQQAEAAAAAPAGGGWAPQFGGRQLTDANLDALLAAIDRHFFGSKMLRKLAAPAAPAKDQQLDQQAPEGGGPRAQLAPARSSAAGVDGSSSSSSSSSLGCVADPQPPGSTAGAPQPPSGCQEPRAGGAGGPAAAPQQDPRAPAAAAAAAAAGTLRSPGQQQRRRLRCRAVQCFEGGWLAYFDTDDNVIYINAWRWAREVSADAPLNCEGVVCTSRLQLLLHTLAHELVHAVVFHLFPDMDAGSAAYTANGRHGPTFALLNKQLFGHSSNALEDVQLLPLPCGGSSGR